MSEAIAATPRPSVLWKGVALALVAAGLFSDLWTKDWMQHRLGMDPSNPHQSDTIHVIQNVFRFEGNWNEGITFGIAAGHTNPILVFTGLACLGILAALIFSRSPSRLLHVSLALILAGAIGNLYDRYTWHKVRDFVVVYWKDWQWPAFNVADSMIVVGVILILWRELFGRRGETAAGRGP